MHISEINQSEKGYIQYDPNYRTFWKRQNYGDDKKISGLPGVGEGMMNKVVTIPYMILYWWIHVIIYLFKPIAYITPRVTPQVNCGLGVIMMCQCTFILGKQCTISGGVLIMREVMYMGRKRVYRKSLYLPFKFAVILNCFKKLKSYKTYWDMSCQN